MCELKTFFYTPNITSTELFSYIIITVGNVLLLYYPIRALLLSSLSNAYTQPDIRLLCFIIINIMSNNNVIISAARWWHNKRSLRPRVKRAPTDWTRFPERGIIILAGII